MDRERIVYYADPSFPKALVERLTARGYQLDAVRRGDDILQRAFAERVSMIIAYTDMPGLGGLSLCQDVKQNAGLRDIPVLVFAQKKGGDRQAFYAVGCEGYYDPPFDEVTVTQRIDELLVDRAKARELSLSRLAIDYKINNDVLRLTPLELQDSTIFLFARSPLAQGTRVKFTLSVSGKTVLDAYGEVSRVEPQLPGRPAGMWLHLSKMDDNSRRLFEGITRQRTLSGGQWEELPVETIVDRVAAAVAGEIEDPAADPLLVRAGFDRAKLPAWEEAAFTRQDDPFAGEADLIGDVSVEATAALREAAGTLHKLQYHLSRYADFFYMGPVAAKKIAVHSEQVLARAEATADVLASILDRIQGNAALAAANQKVTEHLTFAQEDLLERMVRVRTVMGDAQRAPEQAQPTTSDGELCPNQDLRYRNMGLVELFDFSTTTGRKEYARTLPAEMDLSDLAAFDALALLEGRQPCTVLHPDIGAWARALIARELEIAEFMHGRRSTKESRPERIEEIVTFANDKLGALLEVQDHFVRDLGRLAAIRSIPRSQLAELVTTHRRLLRAAALLSSYYMWHAHSGAQDFKARLLAAAQAAENVHPPVDGGGPLVFQSMGEAPPVPAESTKVEAAPKAKGPSLLARVSAHPKFKLIGLSVLGVLALAGAAAAWLMLKPVGEGPLDVTEYRSILPVKSCELRKGGGSEKGKATTTLRCVIDQEWRKTPLPQRKVAARTFVRRLAEKGIKADGVLLLDPFDTEMAVGSGDTIDVY